ncbi:hypothetical protein GCM10007079_51370 [Nocardiopsis terrae]|nr:hypothetical protein GCM10007079_51370 [Nocardiopsis terrae]
MIMASIALLAGSGGLALGVYALSRTREIRSEYRALAQRALAVNSSGADPRAVRDVAVLHYDALEEMSGARSFSLAMLNSHGDGVVVTSINGRTETRTYAKAVTRGEADHLLSPEEYRVIRSARLGNGIGSPAAEPGTPGPGRAERARTDRPAHEETDAMVTVVQGAESPEPDGPDTGSAGGSATAGGAPGPAASGGSGGPRAAEPRTGERPSPGTGAV